MNPQLLQTLADPTRLRVLEALRFGERQVGDVVDALDIQQSGVSRHLRILLDAGVVQVRPDGQKRLYSLRPEPFRELLDWVEGYRDVWEARVDRFGAALAKKQQSRLAPQHKPPGNKASNKDKKK